MFKFSKYSNGFYKKKSKFLNSVFKQMHSNSFLLDSLTAELYEELLKLVPETIAVAASINSRESFEYYLNYSIEDIKLILKNNNNNNWSLSYKVNPTYLDTNNKLNQNTDITYVNAIVMNLKDFYKKNVIKYSH